jgi:hypothetical protein
VMSKGMRIRCGASGEASFSKSIGRDSPPAL